MLPTPTPAFAALTFGLTRGVEIVMTVEVRKERAAAPPNRGGAAADRNDVYRVVSRSPFCNSTRPGCAITRIVLSNSYSQPGPRNRPSQREYEPLESQCSI